MNKNSPYERTAESWEISANKNGSCKILNTEYKGKTLDDLFNDKNIKKEIFGTNCEHLSAFPILIKFIDAQKDLSIQVHPDDKYANNIGESNGKNELWYIIDCYDNSQIIGGLNKQLTKNELKNCIENNTIKNHLNYIDVKKGDYVFINAGTIHAILKNNLICEIQQNSDITYRVYDWDRVDSNGQSRPLHKKEAIETINTNNIPTIMHSDNKKNLQNLISNEYFTIDKINCNKNYIDNSSLETFYAINIVNGQGLIKFNNQVVEIKIGDSFIIPATLGSYEIIGEIEFLKTYIKK